MNINATQSGNINVMKATTAITLTIIMITSITAVILCQFIVWDLRD